MPILSIFVTTRSWHIGFLYKNIKLQQLPVQLILNPLLLILIHNTLLPASEFSLSFFISEGKWCLLRSCAKALINMYCTEKKYTSKHACFKPIFKSYYVQNLLPVLFRPTQSLRAYCLLQLLAVSQVFTPFCLILYPQRQQMSYFHHPEKLLAEAKEWALVKEENTLRHRCASDIIITVRIDGLQITWHL